MACTLRTRAEATSSGVNVSQLHCQWHCQSANGRASASNAGGGGALTLALSAMPQAGIQVASHTGSTGTPGLPWARATPTGACTGTGIVVIPSQVLQPGPATRKVLVTVIVLRGTYIQVVVHWQCQNLEMAQPEASDSLSGTTTSSTTVALAA